MRFSVITANETETVYDGTFKVEDSGMLIISPDNEEEPAIRLSPSILATDQRAPLLLRHARLRLRGREVGGSACGPRIQTGR
jgi:hypothetical protein